ncbi:MAG: DUF3800 domain-containing protein [Candidatus Paceibacterota bacterium]|jgi:hypothetical protein
MTAQDQENYFAFIDEAGNSSQERFFGLGLLLIDDEIGYFYDSMKPFYDRVFENAKLIKARRVEILKSQNDVGQLSQIANSGVKFELKFKYVNFSNNLIYKAFIDNYFQFPNVRFCALVIDREDQALTSDLEPWDTYIHRAAMLLANNIKHIQPCNICVLADDLTRPRVIRKTFEQSLKDAINARLIKMGIGKSVFGVTRLESHASLMLQAVDVLLGAVMYDFKKQQGFISEKLALRQDVVVREIRQKLGTDTLAKNYTYNKPNYFSVWKLGK